MNFSESDGSNKSRTTNRKEKMGKKYKRVLTIAGSDSGGGAGIQADLKTFSALGCYGMSAITAVTAQNTLGVLNIHPIPIPILKSQLAAVLEDIGTDAVKIGMLHSPEVIMAVDNILTEFNVKNIVIDPVMVATSGDVLLQQDAIQVLRELLIPKAILITPNIPEAEILLGCQLKSQEDLPEAAEQLSLSGATSVMLKAGHLSEETLVDYFYESETKEMTPFSSKRLDTINTHGTGCTLSSAITAYLGRGYTLKEAVRLGKDYLSMSIEVGCHYKLGHGHGPVHHFHRFWD